MLVSVWWNLICYTCAYEQSISGFDYIIFLYGAMFELAEVTENGILQCRNIQFTRLLRLLSISDSYSRDTMKGEELKRDILILSVMWYDWKAFKGQGENLTVFDLVCKLYCPFIARFRLVTQFALTFHSNSSIPVQQSRDLPRGGVIHYQIKSSFIVHKIIIQLY